ncbi:MAG: hypothetical protein U1E45_16665 [Geminicoccaceae bacterium]
MTTQTVLKASLPRARSKVASVVPARHCWRPEQGGEPPLAELLDDPIMTQLWRSDRLDPERARATVLQLQRIVRK